MLLGGIRRLEPQLIGYLRPGGRHSVLRDGILNELQNLTLTGREIGHDILGVVSALKQRAFDTRLVLYPVREYLYRVRMGLASSREALGRPVRAPARADVASRLCASKREPAHTTARRRPIVHSLPPPVGPQVAGIATSLQCAACTSQ